MAESETAHEMPSPARSGSDARRYRRLHATLLSTLGASLLLIAAVVAVVVAHGEDGGAYVGGGAIGFAVRNIAIGLLAAGSIHYLTVRGSDQRPSAVESATAPAALVWAGLIALALSAASLATA